MSQPAEPSRLSRRTPFRLSGVPRRRYRLGVRGARDIDIDCATTDLGGHSPTVQVTAYGATPITVSA